MRGIRHILSQVSAHGLSDADYVELQDEIAKTRETGELAAIVRAASTWSDAKGSLLIAAASQRLAQLQGAPARQNVHAPPAAMHISGVRENGFAHHVFEAAQSFISRNIGFPSAGTMYFPSSWNKTVEGQNAFSVNSPSDAVKNFFRATSNIQVDCLVGSQVVLLEALRREFGDSALDEMSKVQIGSIFINQFNSTRTFKGERFRNDSTPADAQFRATLQPGDIVYFKNPNVNEFTRARGWSGENAVYLGTDKVTNELVYFAHPMGIVTADAILSRLKKERKEVQGEPFLSNMIVRISGK